MSQTWNSRVLFYFYKPRISLKYGSTNQEYYKNIMEFAKPLADSNEP